MATEQLIELVQRIVRKACALKNKYTQEQIAPVNYACVFAQNQDEFEQLVEAANKLGIVARQTSSGPLYIIEPLKTVSGVLRVLKIRIQDKSKPERGDADFTVPDYFAFKVAVLGKPGFKLIERSYMEMVELMEPGCNVRAYFSNPPLNRQLGLT